MSFGKRPLAAKEIAAFRSHADAEVVRRACSHEARRSALQVRIDEHLADLRERFGDDERLRPIAVTLAIAEVLNEVEQWRLDGDAAIDALRSWEALESGDSFIDDRLAKWAESVAAPPPKKRERTALPPFARALSLAGEMYWAFTLTNGRKAGPTVDPFADPVSSHLIGAFAWAAKGLMIRGARFERDPEAIVLDWVSRPTELHEKYRPGMGLHAPRAFLEKQFRFRLDDERRLIDGGASVRPAWIRDMRKKGLLGPSQNPSAADVEQLQKGAEARMMHAPPAKHMISSTLRVTLDERKEAGQIAFALAQGNVRRLDAAHRDHFLRLVELEFLEPVLDWLARPAARRGALPEGAVAVNVPTGARSVDALVGAYEEQRGQPFEKRGAAKNSSRLIPERELERIINFANAEAERRANKRCGASDVKKTPQEAASGDLPRSTSSSNPRSRKVLRVQDDRSAAQGAPRGPHSTGRPSRRSGDLDVGDRRARSLPSGRAATGGGC